MRLRNIQFRNIKSYGNRLETIDFLQSGGLWQIMGQNGGGKSSLIDLPKILFYGKLDGFKKEDISNRLNKHGYIKGEIELNPDTIITIERTFAPSDLKVYKHKPGELPNKDNDIGKSGINNYQDYIDNEVTGLPYYIFSNIISLSVNDFKSFISMTPADKRSIIDKLFSMEILNQMNKIIKDDLKKIKTDITIFDSEILSLNRTIETAKTELETLKQKLNEDNTQQIQLLKNKLIEYKPKLEEAANKLKEYTAKEKDIRKSYDVFKTQKSNINNDIRQIKKELELFDNDKCPMCKTPFSEKRFEIVKEELDINLKKKNEELETLLGNESKYETVLKKTQEAISKLNTIIVQIKTNYRTIQIEIEKLNGEKPKEFSSIENIISKSKTDIVEKQGKKSNLDDDYKYKAILEQLYSEDGVKKKILNNYLPILNKELEETLNELRFPYKLSFDNDFEPIIEQLGIKVNEETLSTGEKKKSDLAVLISIIKMLKRKYPTLNIFMLDEILSSIDSDGVYDILSVLQKTSIDLAINILIINHAKLPIEYFTKRVKVKKIDGFSEIELLNEN